MLLKQRRSVCGRALLESEGTRHKANGIPVLEKAIGGIDGELRARELDRLRDRYLVSSFQATLTDGGWRPAPPSTCESATLFPILLTDIQPLCRDSFRLGYAVCFLPIEILYDSTAC